MQILLVDNLHFFEPKPSELLFRVAQFSTSEHVGIRSYDEAMVRSVVGFLVAKFSSFLLRREEHINALSACLVQKTLKTRRKICATTVSTVY